MFSESPQETVWFMSRALTQHSPNPYNYQIDYGHNNSDLDQRYGEADEQAENAERYAGGCQNEGHANSQHEQRQQDNSHYLQNIGCFFHLFYLIPFTFSLCFTGLSISASIYV